MSMVKKGHSPTQKVVKAQDSKKGIVKCSNTACNQMYLAAHGDCPFCSGQVNSGDKK